MFGRRSNPNELPAPAGVAAHREATEILRAWTTPDAGQLVVLRTTWTDPAAWGLMLVDLARHAAQAYEREGLDRHEALARIRAGFDAEWGDPTDSPRDLTDAQ